MNWTITFNTLFAPQSNRNISNYTSQLCRNVTDITTFLVTSYVLETILGVLGNICFILILAKQKEKVIITNIFISNLIASELIMCIFCLPFTIVTTLLDYWVFGEAMCRVTSFIQCTSVTVSILSLVLIALERHQLIINPTGWRPSLSQAYLGIAIVWIFASALSLPFVLYSTLIDSIFKQLPHIMDSYAGRAICMPEWPSKEYRLIYATALLLLQYCIPLLFILVCYVRIYFRLQKRKGMFEKSEHSCRMIQMKRVNVLLASMVVAFAGCWLPLHIFNSVEDWDYTIIPNCLHDLVFSLCHLVAMASACINPIIYGFLNKNFRKEVKTLLLNCQYHSSMQEYEHLPLSTVQTEEKSLKVP